MIKKTTTIFILLIIFSQASYAQSDMETARKFGIEAINAFNQKDYKLALDNFNKVENYLGESEKGYYYKTLCNYYLKKYEEAKSCFDKYIGYKPRGEEYSQILQIMNNIDSLIKKEKDVKDFWTEVESESKDNIPGSRENANSSIIYNLTLTSEGKLKSKGDALGEILGIVPAGATVGVYGYEKSYYKVNYNGKTGFLNDLYFSGAKKEYKNNTLNNSSANNISYYLKLTSDGKLKDSGDTFGKVLEIVPAGRTVLVYSKEKGYYKVNYGGKTGFMNELYFTGAVKEMKNSEKVASSTYFTIKEGYKIPEIKGFTNAGDLFKLSYLKGKIVLIDFWAAWCGPCLNQNPYKVRAYQKYRNKNFNRGNGFTIVSISLDSSKQQWENAIIDQDMSWPYHICDLKKWHSEYATGFRVRSIPTNILIDKYGIVIGQNLFGENLLNTLESLVQE